jgi:hypothetical protein
MIAQQPRLSLSLVLDSSGGHHQLLEVANDFVGQDDPEFALDELGHFFSEKGSMILRGFVASTADASVFLVR